MPISYQIDPRARRITSSFFGVVSDEDIENHIQTLKKDQLFNSDFEELIDCSQITKIMVSSQFIRVIANRQLGSSRSSFAIVAPDNVVFGIARMFQMQQNHVVVGVFRSLDEAQAWLRSVREGVSPARKAADYGSYN